MFDSLNNHNDMPIKFQGPILYNQKVVLILAKIKTILYTKN